MTQMKRYLRYACLAACMLHGAACDRVSDLPGLLLPSVSPAGLRPNIIASSPAQGATAATAGTEIYVEFDRDMDLESTRNAFSLSGSTSAAGTLRFEGRRIYYDLEDELVPGNSYTLRVAGTAESSDGVNMQIDYLVFFSIGTATNAPTLLSSTPANNAQGVAVNSAIVMNFSRAMNRQSVENAFSISPTAAGAFTWGAGDTQLTYTPFADLNFATTYSVTISVGATDTEGISLSTTNNFSFQVGTDFTKPTVTDVREVGNVLALVDGQAGVFKDSAFSITFDEPMDFSPSQSAFSLTRLDNSTTVAGVLNWNATFTQLTFTPNDPLEPSRQYRLRVTTGAQDVAGNALDLQLTRTFTVDNSMGAVNSNYLTVTAMQKIAPGAVQGITLSPLVTTTLNIPGSNLGADGTIEITFSQNIDAGTVPTNITLTKLFGPGGSSSIQGVAVAGNVVTVFVNSFNELNQYQLKLIGGRNGIKSTVVGLETGTFLSEDFVVNLFIQL